MRQTALAAAIAVIGTQADAAPIADGKLSAGEYSLGYSIAFLDQGGLSIGDGKLFFGQSASGQFIYFQMPLTFVDNTYGLNAAPDWGSKGHTFDNLLGSDSLGTKNLGFQWNGNSIVVDYIAGEGCSGDKKSTTCADFRSGGVGLGADASLSKNEGDVLAGSAASILEIATSLEYNLNQYPAFINSDDSPGTGVAPDWINEIGYELQFAPGTFNSSDFLNPAKAHTLVDLGMSHVSPPKTQVEDFGQPQCILGCTTQVPEPSTSLLLLAGAFSAAAFIRRRRPRTG